MTVGETIRDAPMQALAEGAVLRSQLILTLECDRPLAGGMRIDLHDVDELIVGRGPSRTCVRDEGRSGARLVVRVPASAMSATHARITRSEGHWIVHDLGSTNGVRVNGKAATTQRLWAGDVIEMGHALFYFLGEIPVGLVADQAESFEDREASQLSDFATLTPAVERQLRTIERMATSRIPVIITGETGTGKELVARHLHARSGRTKSFVPVNCAALPASLIESQLFGHCRGAFSGAVRDQPGLVRAADSGTLFLDEIGDLPLLAQGSLLRVLQEGEVLAVGETRATKVDVRIVAATHRDLHAMASAGTFRLDLLARLEGATVQLPPLRERRADLGVLTSSLLRRIAGKRAHRLKIDPPAALAMIAYAWPANVRELEQCLGHAVALADDTLRREHLPKAVANASNAAPGTRCAETAVRQGARESLVAHLQAHGGNVAAVARTLGKAPVQIHRWMRKFAIDPNAYRNHIDSRDA